MYSKGRNWLKAMENGALGEARTRAFLLERFWILERSVDIEGADMLIQRRSMTSLLEPKAPRLGIIQAKYFQDDRTTHHVHETYICDVHGRPWGEFFLICHTGSGEQNRMYLLTAKEVQENFAVTSGQFVLPGRIVLDSRWVVADKAQALDLIEQALVKAEFASNRSFLRRLLPDDAKESILPGYGAGIERSDKSIPYQFNYLRDQANKEARQMIEELELLADIANTDDPLQAVEIAYKLSRIGDRRYGMYGEDFHGLLLREKSSYEELRAASSLQQFTSFRDNLKRQIIDDCIYKFPFRPSEMYFVDVTYVVSTFKITSFASRVVDRSVVNLRVMNSYSDNLLGIEKTPCSVSTGFVFWSKFFDQGDIIVSGYTPNETITAWVECLLGYIMSDVLDCWRNLNSSPQ